MKSTSHPIISRFTIRHNFSAAIFGALAYGLMNFTTLSAKAPDLTAGEPAPFGDIWFNLGPTGVQAWVYRGEDKDPKNAKRRMWPTVETPESRQILVQTIDKGSPADGILNVGDVILGANGTGAKPTPFAEDARITFGKAIVDAEARNPGLLKMIVWRAGKTSELTMTLRTMGAYSATAPYKCPKSAKILEESLDYIMTHETEGFAGMSTLALLAGNDPSNPKNAARQKKAQEYAHTQILNQNTIDFIKLGNVEAGGSIAWNRGLRLIVLSEYYLKTKDPKVLPSIEAVALSIAHGQGANGAVGHKFNISLRDGVYNDPFTIGYTMNASTLPTALGLVLARKCELKLPELEPAIERVVRTLSAASGMGTYHYYVEGPPLENANEDNGKSGLGALCFAIQEDRKQEARFFSKLSTGATFDRGRGHIINYFGYIWTPLGANVGGEYAAASYFNQIKPEMDLCRHWDGGFEYERYNSAGKDPSMACSNMWMSTAAILTYAAPLRQIEITGSTFSKSPELVLSHEEVAEAVLSDRYDAKQRTTKELLDDLKSNIPRLSSKSAIELAARPEESSKLVQALIDHLKVAEPSETMGICRFLGEMKAVEGISSLIGLLSHKDKTIRYLAAEALTKYPPETLREHLNTLLKIVAANARPAFPLDRDDPQQFANLMLCKVLIGNWGTSGLINSNITGVDRNLLYPALHAWATNPHAETRKRVALVLKKLTPEDVIALSDTLIACAGETSITGSAAAPADAAIELLLREGLAEGVGLTKTNMLNLRFKNMTNTLKLLEKYGASAATVKPDPKIAEFLQDMLVGNYNGQVSPEYREQIDRMLKSLLTANNPPALKTLKQLNSINASPTIVKLPTKQTQLKAVVTDLASGKTTYTWRKVHGPGEVTFSVNGTSESGSTTVNFDGTPGRYLFEVTAGDSRNLTQVTGTVAVELRNTKDALPPNKPPIVSAQSVTAAQAIPTPVILTAKDPEGYALVYEITSSPAHGTLSGSAPNVTYLSGFQFTGPDSFSYRVMDSDGQWSAPTPVNLTVKTRVTPVGLALYEPFDYKEGMLRGATGSSEIGFTGAWEAHKSNTVIPNNISCGGIPAKGKAMNTGKGAVRPLDPSGLAANGLLKDGAELWLCLQVQYSNNADRKVLDMILANNGYDELTGLIKNDSTRLGQGVGVNIGMGTKAVLYESVPPAENEFGNGNGIKLGEAGIIVAKIKWGKDLDVMEVYIPQADMTLPKPISTLHTKVDQSTFDTMIIRGSVILDEIRMGPTLESVLLGTVPMSPK
jgi:hypothetical protein